MPWNLEETQNVDLSPERRKLIMNPFYVDYLNSLAELHTEIIQTIRYLPQEALDWIPFSGGNSLSVMIVHLTGAEKYWMGDVIAGESSGRDRPAEFQVKNVGIEDLESRLNESLGYAELVLSKLELDDLELNRISPRDGQEMTVSWALDHALKHTAIHVGHIQITRQLWDQEKVGD